MGILDTVSFMVFNSLVITFLAWKVSYTPAAKRRIVTDGGRYLFAVALLVVLDMILSVVTGAVPEVFGNVLFLALILTIVWWNITNLREMWRHLPVRI